MPAEFSPDTTPGLLRVARMGLELEAALGRRVELLMPVMPLPRGTGAVPRLNSELRTTLADSTAV